MFDLLEKARDAAPTGNPFYEPLKKHEISRIKSLRTELGKSYGSIHSYAKNGTWPAELCIQVEHLTNGEITATRMRPEIFTFLSGHRKLCNLIVETCCQEIPDYMEPILISLMNILEELDIKLYDDLIERLSHTEVGERIVTQRLAHKEFG